MDIHKSFSYEEYRNLIKGLLEEGKTTGPNQTEAFIEYTKMNHQRMNRWDKKANLNEPLIAALKNISTPQKWVVLTEGWCGDAAHSIPVIAKMAEENPLIQLELILRDENLEIMDQYLTNGGRSIPKLVAFDATGNELFTWGPRPQELQELHLQMKKEPEKAAESKIIIQQWYNKDKTQAIQKEFLAVLT